MNKFTNKPLTRFSPFPIAPQEYEEQLQIAIQMASKTGASPSAKHRIESLKKAKNDLTTHHSYVISMSMKSVKQSPKMSREAQPQQATQTVQAPAEAKDGDSQKNDIRKGESWLV